MADEDEYSYTPNEAIMGAVRASGGLRAGGGLGPARPDAPRSMESYLNSLRPKARRKAMIELRKQEEAAAHNAAMESVARAKFALDQSNAFYGNAKERHDMIQQANQLNQSANFFAEHANLNPYAPDYYQHVNTLAAKYPGATENKAIQGILSNPKLREQAALKGDVPGEVATRNAFQKGWLKAADLENPKLLNQDGSFNHDAASELATLREGASVEAPHIKTARQTLMDVNKLGTDLTPQQQQLADMATNTLLQFEKGRQESLGIPQPKKVSAGSFLPRVPAAAPVPAAIPSQTAPEAAAEPQHTSIPKAPPPPTPAPQPISPEDATRKLQQMGINPE